MCVCVCVCVCVSVCVCVCMCVCFSKPSDTTGPNEVRVMLFLRMQMVLGYKASGFGQPLAGKPNNLLSQTHSYNDKKNGSKLN